MQNNTQVVVGLKPCIWVKYFQRGGCAVYYAYKPLKNCYTINRLLPAMSIKHFPTEQCHLPSPLPPFDWKHINPNRHTKRCVAFRCNVAPLSGSPIQQQIDVIELILDQTVVEWPLGQVRASSYITKYTREMVYLSCAYGFACRFDDCFRYNNSCFYQP